MDNFTEIIIFSCEATQETAHVRASVHSDQLAISQLHTS